MWKRTDPESLAGLGGVSARWRWRCHQVEPRNHTTQSAGHRLLGDGPDAGLPGGSARTRTQPASSASADGAINAPVREAGPGHRDDAPNTGKCVESVLRLPER